ncbi:MAG TPA: transketolase [Anaerovoracaceae bacterium]|nr:transketolase [Anaerovoracaceae bacterium]
MDVKKKKFLYEKARELRKLLIQTIGEFGQGHIGGCLSIIEVLTVLYYDQMNIDPKNPKMEGRDRFILSKGHAGPALYCALALKGFFPAECLKTLNRPHTDFPSHCDMNKTPGVDMTAGSLGQGISCAVGIAKAAQMKCSGEYTYVIIGDGESQEGSVWEASMAAAHYKLDHFIAFLDFNKLQIDGSIDEIMSLGDPVAKWRSFGFNTFRVDGHNVEEISKAITAAKKKNNGKPSMIVLDTVKGKGVSFIEAQCTANHSMPISAEQVELALAELNREVF